MKNTTILMSYKHENYAFVNKYGIRTHEQHSVRSMEMNVCHVNRISSQKLNILRIYFIECRNENAMEK